MGPSVRHFKNGLNIESLPKLDCFKELLASLERINTYNPPVHTCSTGWSFSGLYQGPTSVAYLFFRLSQIYPHLNFKSQSALDWAEDYLKLSGVYVAQAANSKADVSSQHCGIANETLAHLAVSSVINNDTSLSQRLCGYEGRINAEGGSNEWLYGRAGYLYFLRLCRNHFDDDTTVTKQLDQSIENTINRITQTPLPWTWHGEQYLGAAHGYVGIITQIVLSLPFINSSKRENILQGLEKILIDLLEIQFKSGNFPPSADDRFGNNGLDKVEVGSDQLVQFCHGGPGFITSLRSMKQHLTPEVQQRVCQVTDLAKQDTWERGLLTKESCLCHGIAGNALAFTGCGDPRFEQFLACMTTEQLEKLSRSDSSDGFEKDWLEDAGKKDGFVGLYTGEAGRAWVWAVADQHLMRTFLGFNDI